MTDIAQFNADWLAAWTAKDVERLLTFYAEDATYIDPAVPHGIQGHEAMRAYLTALFAAQPTTVYTPDETWPIAGGFCGRWYCDLGEGGSAGRMRGFDLVLLDGDRIAHNEVFVHELTKA